MRPVFVTPHVDATGGTERQIHLLAPAFVDAGHPVRVVSRTPHGAVPPLPPGCLVPVDLAGERLLEALRARRTRRPSDAPSRTERDTASTVAPRPSGTPTALARHAARRALDAVRVDALARRLVSLRPTVVHVHGTFSFVHLRAAARAAQRLGIPWVVKIANEPGRVLAQLAEDDAAQAALRAADRVVAVTDGAAEALRRAGLRAVVIPNAVAFPTSPERLRVVGPLLFVGTFKPQKNLPVLLEAYARLPRSLRVAHPLRLVGAGPLRASLEAQATALGVRETLEVPGPTTDVAGELDRAARFVLPSAFEGMSNALLEACAAGVPAIASDVDGNHDVLGAAGRGGLVPAGDVDALHRALVRSLEDPVGEQRRATAVRTALRARHAPAAVVDAMIALYASVGARG